jgi:hypothetical protein
MNSIHNVQRTPYLSITRIYHFVLYREVNIVGTEIHTKHKYTVWAERRVLYILHQLKVKVNVKPSLYKPGQALECSRRLRLQDFKTIGTWW